MISRRVAHGSNVAGRLMTALLAKVAALNRIDISESNKFVIPSCTVSLLLRIVQHAQMQDPHVLSLSMHSHLGHLVPCG